MRDFSGVSGADGGLAKQSPAPATQWTAPVANAIVQELCNVVTNENGGNAGLNPGDNGQVLAAILAIVARSLPVSIDFDEKSVDIGGFIIKLGSNLGNYSEQTIYTPFPTPFPNACWGAFPIVRNDTGGTTRDFGAQAQGAPTKDGFTTKLNLGGGGTTNSIDGFDYVAFGI